MQFIDPSLRRDIFGWHSPNLSLDMPIVRYGHWGPALLLFPTAAGDFLEAERMFLIKSIEPAIFAGRVQVFAIESINKHAWMNEQIPVWDKARNQSLYSRYVEEEVVPHIRRVLQDDGARIGATGASFGAFYAANAFFRRPDMFQWLIAMSGFYQLGRGYLGDWFHEDVYFNSPLAYLPNMQEGHAMNLLRHHSQIHILAGRGSYERPESSEALSHALHAKGISHNLDLWGHDMPHDWPTWRQMLPHYVNERLGW
ncbi:MAG: esterase family protein [Myxococcaceae bacterium]